MLRLVWARLLRTCEHNVQFPVYEVTPRTKHETQKMENIKHSFTLLPFLRFYACTLLRFYYLPFYPFTLLRFYPFTLLRFYAFTFYPFTLLRFYPFTLLLFTLLPFYPFTLLPFYFTLLRFYPFSTVPLLPFYPFTLFTAEQRKKNTLEQSRSGWRLRLHVTVYEFRTLLTFASHPHLGPRT